MAQKQKQKKNSRRYRGEVIQLKGRSGWYYRLRIGDKRPVRKGGEDRDEAEQALADALKRLKEGLPLDGAVSRDESFEKFVKVHLKYAKARHTESTHKIEKIRLGKVKRHFKGWKLATIRRADVEKFLLDLSEEGAKPATRNRYLAAIRRLFEDAVDLGYMKVNPLSRMRQIKEEERPVPVLSLADQQALVDGCHSRIRDLVLVALDTGCRQGELLKLEWSDFDKGRATLTIRTSKNKKPRVVHLTARVCELLKTKKKGRTIPLEGPDRVFSKIPANWSSYDGRLYRQAAAVIGHPGLRFHDLRHQTAINLTRAGVLLADVQKWLGHSSLRMTMRYSAHSPENSGELALAKLERRLAQKPACATGTE